MKDRMSKTARRRAKQRSQLKLCPNKTQLIELVQWVLPEGAMFSQDEFHGNVRWNPNQLAAQALVWSWQETKHVTDAFDHAQEVCDELGWQQTARSYTSLMNALDRYDQVWMRHLQERCQTLAEGRRTILPHRRLGADRLRWIANHRAKNHLQRACVLRAQLWW
jgi:hypothetical protein